MLLPWWKDKVIKKGFLLWLLISKKNIKYISDPRKVEPSKMKTVIRHPIRKVTE